MMHEDVLMIASEGVRSDISQIRVIVSLQSPA